MGKSNKNVEGLLIYHKNRNLETIEKVNIAITSLKKGKKKITITAVAKKAGVAVASIYNNPTLKERIDQLKEIENCKICCEASDKPKNLKDIKIDELKGIINKLQLELEDEKKKNSLLLGHLERKSSENLELKIRIKQYRETLKIKG